MNPIMHVIVTIFSVLLCALILWEDFSPYGLHRLWIIPLVFLVFVLIVTLIGPFTVTVLQLFQNFK
jgi:hypothetical protein